MHSQCETLHHYQGVKTNMEIQSFHSGFRNGSCREMVEHQAKDVKVRGLNPGPDSNFSLEI